MFKPQFAPLVKDGSKRQTIRPTPKRPVLIGSKESWRKWSGKPYRSSQIELAQVVVTNVRAITLAGFGMFIVSGKDATWDEAQEIARMDGFESLEAMMQWFYKEHGLPFEGILINAKDLKSHGTEVIAV